MSEIGSGPNSRIQPRPGGDVAGGAAVSRPAGGRSRRNNNDASGFNVGQFFDQHGDIEAAFNRLRTLLAFDGENGPRPGIQRRGYYLNILV